jgi:hypothetical protein
LNSKTFLGVIKMSNRWEKEDRAVWEKSEVMQELEKKVLDNMRRVEAMAQKIAQDADTQAKATAVMNSDAPPAEKKEIIKNLVDDEPEENELDSQEEEATQELMLNELRQMAQVAISKGNIKVAYQIERTIEEILEDEF